MFASSEETYPMKEKHLVQIKKTFHNHDNFLHCSWFQPELNRQTSESALKEKVDIFIFYLMM